MGDGASRSVRVVGLPVRPSWAHAAVAGADVGDHPPGLCRGVGLPVAARALHLLGGLRLRYPVRAAGIGGPWVPPLLMSVYQEDSWRTMLSMHWPPPRPNAWSAMRIPIARLQAGVRQTFRADAVADVAAIADTTTTSERKRMHPSPFLVSRDPSWIAASHPEGCFPPRGVGNEAREASGTVKPYRDRACSISTNAAATYPSAWDLSARRRSVPPSSSAAWSRWIAQQM